MAAHRPIVLSMFRGAVSPHALAFLVLASLQMALFPVAHAQPAPIGPQFQVNTYTTHVQYGSAVASDGGGNFVVVWPSSGSAGTDTSQDSVQGRFYDSSGTPLGGEFQVNTYTTSTQFRPAVAMDTAGNVVVVWGSDGSGGTDTYWASVQAQRYDSAGLPQGAQLQVNAFTVGSQFDPRVAFDGSGNFVVVWTGQASAGTDNSYNSIHGQRYDSSGAPLGGEFQVNTYVTGHQEHPALAVDSLGNFLVAWESSYSAGTDTSSRSIQAQRYDSTGTPQGTEFQVNTYTTNVQAYPSAAVDGTGNFLVVWENSFGGTGSDPDGSIQGQRYDPMGAPLGGEFQVNTYTTSGQRRAAVTVDGTGRFVVVWQSYGSVGSDTFASSIQGQRFDAAGMADGGQLQVNAFTPNTQRVPAVAADSVGNLLASWSSHTDGTGSDTDQWSIQARRFVPMALTTTSTVVTSTTSTSSSTTSTTSTSSTSSSSITTTTYPQVWVPGKLALIKPGTLFKFIGKPVGFTPFGDLGTGTLRVFDTGASAGDNTYSLPAAGWTALGNPPGYGGQKYRGAGTPGDPCKIVLVKNSIVKAVCKGSDVTLQPPFTGDVGIVLTLSTNDHYCLRFGGDEVKNTPDLLKRKNAPYPVGCPE